LAITRWDESGELNLLRPVDGSRSGIQQRVPGTLGKFEARRAALEQPLDDGATGRLGNPPPLSR
jgi:hypothetical protein